MLMLVSYDVSTETREGRKRLRRVAKICQNYGQRVQKSVFECRVNAGNLELLKSGLLDIINEEQDSLRFYRITEPLEKNMMEFGKTKAIDFDNEALIL